jgi:hypothetical protein
LSGSIVAVIKQVPEVEEVNNGVEFEVVEPPSNWQFMADPFVTE